MIGAVGGNLFGNATVRHLGQNFDATYFSTLSLDLGRIVDVDDLRRFVTSRARYFCWAFVVSTFSICSWLMGAEARRDRKAEDIMVLDRRFRCVLARRI